MEWKAISSESIRKSLQTMDRVGMVCGVSVLRIFGDTYVIDGESTSFTLDAAVDYLYDIQPIE